MVLSEKTLNFSQKKEPKLKKSLMLISGSNFGVVIRTTVKNKNHKL